MEQVRLGIIGVGNMGSGHTANIMAGKVPEVRITAAADLRESRREWAKENMPEGTAIFEDGDSLIKSGTCDAVLIAVPHYDHPRLTILALENGLHVMCEKPAGVYTKQVREMNEVAEKSDRVFGMMFNQRTNCIYKKMHDMVQSGDYGKLKRVNWIITDWYRTQAYYNSGGWRATWDGEGGGVLLNQCPHNLDLLQWICGMPSKVRAFCHNGKWHDIEVEDDVTAYMEFANGATGVFITTTGDAPGTNRLEITGTKGRIICENDQLTYDKLEEDERIWCVECREGFRKPESRRIEVETDGQNPQHAGVLNAFAAHIASGAPLVADGREGIRGLMLSNAIHLSGWTGETVELPIDEQRFLELLRLRCASSRRKEDHDVVMDTSESYGSRTKG
mgnify:FL=1